MAIPRRSKSQRDVTLPGLYTCDQAAKKLGMKPDTVRRYVHRGLIKAGLIGDVYIISDADLAAFSSNRRKPGRPAPASGKN